MEATPDEAARFVALQAAQWFYDATETAPKEPGDVVDMAALFEHYLSNGQTVAFDCKDGSRKFIAGKA